MGAYPGLRDGEGGPGAAARNEYLAAENRIMKEQLEGRLKLSDAEAQIAPVQHAAGVRDRWISGPFPPPFTADLIVSPLSARVPKAQ